MGENLCDNCPDNVKGLCCYSAIAIEGYNIILKNHPCKHLDLKTKKCLIYNERFSKRRECLTAIEGLTLAALPEGCLYIKKYGNNNTPFKINYIPENISDRAKRVIEYHNLMRHDLIAKY